MKPLMLTIPGSIRSKKNSKTVAMIGGKNKPRRPIILPSKAYKKWEKEARLAIKVQLPYGFKPTEEKISLMVFAYYKGQEPDLSGCLESIGDCLEGVVFENDKQIASWDGSRKFHDKENPRTEVTIRKHDV